MEFINKVAECLYQGAATFIEDRSFASPEEIVHDVSPETLAKSLMLTAGISMGAYIAYIANREVAKKFPHGNYFHQAFHIPAGMCKSLSYCGLSIFLTASSWFMYLGLKDGCWNERSVHLSK